MGSFIVKVLTRTRAATASIVQVTHSHLICLAQSSNPQLRIKFLAGCTGCSRQVFRVCSSPPTPLHLPQPSKSVRPAAGDPQR